MSDPRTPPCAHSDETWPVRRRLGAGVLAFGVLQFFLVHLVVQTAWEPPYNWAHNNISDLGNVRCGEWGAGADQRYVCSPRHELMNVSFVALGATLLVGVVLVRRHVGMSRTTVVLLAAAAIGFATAGLAPADVDEDTHVLLGAVPIFFLGNAGLVTMGLSRRYAASVPIRVSTVAAGMAGIVGAVLFASGTYLGLGMGGMERVPALVMPVWLVVVAGLVPAAAPRGARSASLRV